MMLEFPAPLSVTSPATVTPLSAIPLLPLLTTAPATVELSSDTSCPPANTEPVT
jgi:hypothetical protein